MRRLTDGDVIAMREKGATGVKSVDLAVEYGVGKSMISKVLGHKRYPHLGGPMKTNPPRETFQESDGMRELIKEIEIRHNY